MCYGEKVNFRCKFAIYIHAEFAREISILESPRWNFQGLKQGRIQKLRVGVHDILALKVKKKLSIFGVQETFWSISPFFTVYTHFLLLFPIFPCGWKVEGH